MLSKLEIGENEFGETYYWTKWYQPNYDKEIFLTGTGDKIGLSPFFYRLMRKYQYQFDNDKIDKKHFELRRKQLNNIWENSVPLVYGKYIFDKSSMFEIYSDCFQDIEAYQDRYKRAKKWVDKNLFGLGYCHFVTLTFRDDELQKYKDDKGLIRYVKKFLNENCFGYYCSFEKGKLNDRPHFHAILIWKAIRNEWDKGFVKDSVINDKTGKNKVLKYVMKYVMKDNNCFHSRNKDYKKDNKGHYIRYDNYWVNADKIVPEWQNIGSDDELPF